MATEVVNQIDSENNSIDEECKVNNLTLKKLQEGLCWNLLKILESFFMNADPSSKRIPNP